MTDFMNSYGALVELAGPKDEFAAFAIATGRWIDIEATLRVVISFSIIGKKMFEFALALVVGTVGVIGDLAETLPALLPLVLTPRRTKCFRIVSAFKCLVPRSAGLSAPATFSRPMASLLTWSCSHK